MLTRSFGLATDAPAADVRGAERKSRNDEPQEERSSHRDLLLIALSVARGRARVNAAS